MSSLKILSYWFSRHNRKKKLKFLAVLISEQKITSGLIVGAKPDPTSLTFDNLIEKGLVELLPRVVISGVEKTSVFWKQWIQADGLNLSFPDHSFELVFSNAVIEHVGDEVDQQKFINEHNRVGKSWVFTTPNRLFPVESHTQLLFFHMRKGWSRGDVTRLLSKRDLKRILPPEAKIRGHFLSPTFICYKVQDYGSRSGRL